MASARARAPLASLSLLPPRRRRRRRATSRQFILHDANQAFVLIYAAWQSTPRPLATKSPSFPLPSSFPRALVDGDDAVIVMGVTPLRRVCPTYFYDGLVPSHSYIFRLLIRSSVKKVSLPSKIHDLRLDKTCNAPCNVASCNPLLDPRFSRG